MSSIELLQLDLLASGYPLAEIAEICNESLSATKRRQTALMQKLGARNGTQAVAIAVRRGLV